MEDIDFAMAFPHVLTNFQSYSRSYYIVCAVGTVFVDILVVFLLVAQKFPRNGLKSNHVMLFNLAICDIVYEAATTTVFLQSNSCEIPENCKLLYFIYLALNLCTVFLIMMEIVQKTMLDMGRISHATFSSSVYWSVVSWVAAFTLAYMDFKNESGLMDGSAMAFLERFKAFGYLLFAVILGSGILVILLTVAIGKPHIKKSPFENSLQPPETSRQLEIGLATSCQDDLIFSCLFMAIFVGWCAWVVLGVDSRIMKTVEVMKSFEVIRLAARIFNPLTIMYSFSHRNEQFALREP